MSVIIRGIDSEWEDGGVGIGRQGERDEIIVWTVMEHWRCG